jgi:hypothetical protein
MVERRASVRPSAFGVPRKSEAPKAAIEARGSARELNNEDGAREPAAAHSPHERVLEAARLLDALGPALLDHDPGDDGGTPLSRLPNQRARGADALVAKSARAAPAGEAAGGTQVAASSDSRVDQPASTRPAVQEDRRDPRSLRAAPARLVRNPWLSLLLFAGMVALSVVPLLRYAGSSEESAQPTSVDTPVRSAGLAASTTHAGVHTVPARPALSSAAEREQAIANALSEGGRALELGDVGAAERMFGQVLELAEDNHHAAYGLARVRAKQNNFSGAEGWIQLALRKRPRRAAYHALYAEVLTRMGRLGEARQEQALAEAHEDPRAAGDERAHDPRAK